ncbi:response regulator [Belnapia moabensis]|uniref:response regulator n=1 Tax=Belnapia moabensis TaxID=365533 RepID=UPI0024804433|nr:response regulator [Belnapia moabensis]
MKDGWTTARELRADPATASIPIVALTAHALAGDRDKALEAGCNDYHPKPVEFSRLLEQVEALLRGTGPTGG